MVPEQFQLYPVSGHLLNKSSSKYLYIKSTKEFIISDVLHQRFAKMTGHQVEKCFQLNELNFVYKEEFPIALFKAGDDCGATLLHPQGGTEKLYASDAGN